MKILFITPGFGPWPNNGWGACENLTYELSNELKEIGHDIYIYHSPNNHQLREYILRFRPNIVHCEYDDYIHWLFPLRQEFSNIEFRFTNHWAYLTSKTYPRYSFFQDAITATRMGIQFYCLSQEIADVFTLAGADASHIRIFHNGASETIRFASESIYSRALCVGKVEVRKGQQYLTDLPVDIVGPIHDVQVPAHQYKGHWTRDVLFDSLTNYSTLVLLSEAEAHPLVMCEALMAGLSLVVSRTASANLDTTNPWVYIVDSSDFSNKELLHTIIEESICKNSMYRKQIREYAMEHFSWKKLALKY